MSVHAASHPVAAFVTACRSRPDIMAALPGGISLTGSEVSAALPRAVVDTLDASTERSTGGPTDRVRIRTQRLQVRVVAATAPAAAAAADALAALDFSRVGSGCVHVTLDSELGPYTDPPDSFRSGPDGNNLYVVVLSFTLMFNDPRI